MYSIRGLSKYAKNTERISRKISDCSAIKILIKKLAKYHEAKAIKTTLMTVQVGGVDESKKILRAVCLISLNFLLAELINLS